MDMNGHKFRVGIARVAGLGLILLTSPLYPATYHVSTRGDDAGDGTDARPFRTIQRAADQAVPGDTVLVEPGLYRERVAPARGGEPDKPIVYRSAIPHAATIRGSAVWRPTWKQEAPRIWSGDVSEQMFTDHSQCDGANPFRVPFSSTPWGRDGRPEHERGYPNSDEKLVYTLGQVFVDGELVKQVPNATELGTTENAWFYDANMGRLLVHFQADTPAAAHEVEITTQRRLFAPHRRQLGFITVEGFVFERCSNQYPTNFWEAEHPEWQQAGAVGTRSGHHWTIRDNIVRFATGIGIDLGNEGAPGVDLEIGKNGLAAKAGYHLVENNLIADNGGPGTASYEGVHLVIRDNIVEKNNAYRFTGKKRWESAGIKLHHPTQSVIEHNLVRDNYGKWGIWLDGGAGDDTRVVRNIVIGHRVGIDYEIGNAAPSLCANNILIDNAIGIGTRESGGVTILHNLILNATEAGVSFTVDLARGGRWNAAHNAVFGNLFIAAKGPYLNLTTPDDLRSEDRRLDGNVYAMQPTDQRLAIGKTLYTLPDWQRLWQKYNGDENADLHSKVVAQASFSFDRLSNELELTIPGVSPTGFHPADVRRTTDFFGRTVSPENPVPGPFDMIVSGTQRFRLWDVGGRPGETRPSAP
jgi:Right handed beta helix region/Protein of unknown function (DUF1565)